MNRSGTTTPQTIVPRKASLLPTQALLVGPEWNQLKIRPAFAVRELVRWEKEVDEGNPEMSEFAMEELEKWRRKVQEIDKELSDLAKTPRRSSSTVTQTSFLRSESSRSREKESSRSRKSAITIQPPVLDRPQDVHSRAPSPHQFVSESRGETLQPEILLHQTLAADDPCGWEKRSRARLGASSPGRSSSGGHRNAGFFERMREFERLGVPRQPNQQGRPIARSVHQPSLSELTRRRDVTPVPAQTSKGPSSIPSMPTQPPHGAPKLHQQLGSKHRIIGILPQNGLSETTRQQQRFKFVSQTTKRVVLTPIHRPHEFGQQQLHDTQLELRIDTDIPQQSSAASLPSQPPTSSSVTQPAPSQLPREVSVLSAQTGHRSSQDTSVRSVLDGAGSFTGWYHTRRQESSASAASSSQRKPSDNQDRQQLEDRCLSNHLPVQAHRGRDESNINMRSSRVQQPTEPAAFDEESKSLVETSPPIEHPRGSPDIVFLENVTPAQKKQQQPQIHSHDSQSTPRSKLRPRVKRLATEDPLQSSITESFLRTDGAPPPEEMSTVLDPNMTVEEFLRSKPVQVRARGWRWW